MRFLFLFSIGFFSAFSNPGFAAPCAPVNLRAPGGSAHDVPVTDQGKLGNCFVHLASALMTSVGQLTGEVPKNKSISPLLTTIEYGVKEKRPMEGGRVCEMFNWIKKNPSCDLSQTNLGQKVPGFDLRSNEIRSYLETSAAYAGLDSDLKGQVRGLINKFSPARGPQSTRNCDTPAALLEMPSLDCIQEFLKKDEMVPFMYELSQKACPRNERFLPFKGAEGPSCETKSFIKSPEGFGKWVNDLLDAPNPLPIGIGFCGNFLTEGKNFKGLSGNRSASAHSKACGAHAAMIVGKKTDQNGKCVVGIQNSWGRGCNAYPPEFQCEDGVVWVGVDDLADNMIDGYQVQPPKSEARAAAQRSQLPQALIQNPLAVQ